MATIKSYTDLEQSKKLAEILPLESADMSYFFNFNSEIYEISTTSYKSWVVPKYAQPDDGFGQVIPCWSLAALLGAVDFITINLFYIDERGYWVVSATIHDSTKLCTKYESAIALNPVDACYELIIKLHEQNIL